MPGQKLLPGTQDTVMQWVRGEGEQAAEQRDHLAEAQKEYGRKLDFTNYAMSRNPHYLGIVPTKPRPLYLARSYGNDSSNIIGIYDQASYWKRKYYTNLNKQVMANYENNEEILASLSTGGPQGEKQRAAAKKAAAQRETIPERPKEIHAWLGNITETVGKPVGVGVNKRPGQPWNFITSGLDTKYQFRMNGGAGVSYDWDKKGHRSSPAELTFAASIQRRKDYDAINGLDYSFGM